MLVWHEKKGQAQNEIDKKNRKERENHNLKWLFLIHRVFKYTKSNAKQKKNPKQHTKKEHNSKRRIYI